MRPILYLLVFCLAATPCLASEFRDINRIPRPSKLPEGAQPVAKMQMVDRAIARQAVAMVASNWNSPKLGPLLSSPRFHNKQRLLDTIATYAQRDAKVRVLAIRQVQTLQQYVEGNKLISRISVTAATQLEYNDPNLATKNAEGTVEYIFKISQPLKGETL